MDLSVVILPSDGGIRIHKTLLSVMDAIDVLDEEKNKSELIVVIDDKDSAAAKYCEKHKDDGRIKVVDNKNLFKMLNGQYVGLVVSGDLVSEKWFVEAVKTCEALGKDVVVRPETVICFNNRYECKLRKQYSEFGRFWQRKRLCGMNSWSLSCVLARKTLEKIYDNRMVSSGGWERSYLFDLNIGKAGINNIVVPGTAYFERSRTNDCEDKKAFLVYDDFFNIEKHWEMTLKEKMTENSLVRKINGVSNDDDGKKVTVWLTKNISKEFPEVLVDEWERISQYEPALYPFDWRMARTRIENMSKYMIVGDAYEQITSKVIKSPDYVFIVPWLISGGAEKVLLNYIEALSHIHPEWTFAVITTLKKNNIWESRLPKNAYLLDFGNESDGLNDSEKSILFGRLLVQLGSKRLHLINNRYGYDWIADNIEFIKNDYELNVSVFCYDYVDGEKRKAIFYYAYPYLIDIISAVRKITTDNRANKMRMIEKCGFDEKKIAVHYQPISLKIKSANVGGGRKMKILWASRIAHQKCPDMLIKVAKELDPELFEIDVYGKLEDYGADYFDGVGVIKYMGGFDGFDSIETGKYDVYLYTSAIDGVPNCLLEAIAAGLPIIAPNVGGIAEVINDKTGILVNSYDDISGFVKALEYARERLDEMVRRTSNAQELIQMQHSWEKFEKAVKRDLI